MYGSVPLGVVITTLHGVIVWANGAAERTLRQGEQSLVGRTLGSLRTTGDQDLSAYRSALLAGEPVSREELVQRVDGTEVWLRLHFSVLRDADAGAHLIALFEETTDQHRLERALHDRELAFRALSEATPGTAILLFDRDRRHVVVEGEPTLMPAGLERKRVLGATIESAASPANRARLTRMYDDALAGRVETAEMHRNGRWLEITTAPVRDEAGTIAGGLTVLRDITDRVSDKRDHEQRARRIQLLETVAERANQAMSSREVLRACLELVCTYTKKAVGHVYLPADDGTRLVSSGVWYGDLVGPMGDFLEATRSQSFVPGEGLVGTVFASAEPRWVDELATDPWFTRRELAVKAGLKGGGAFPIVMGDEVAAVVELYATEHEAADEFLRDVVATVGVQFGRTFERERFESTLKKRASCDETTGLLNRRGFIAAAAERMERAQDEDRDLVLFFAEVDGLTDINERLGPTEGEAAIAAAGAVLRSAFGPSDVLSRLGGDEFVVLAEIDPVAIAETRARIVEHAQRMNEGKTRRFHLALDVVTTTVFADGVAEITEYLTTGDALMADARRIRKAKRDA